MRWSRKMQTLLKLGFVFGVCTSLWVLYDSETVGKSIDAGVKFLGNYVDLSAFGATAKPKPDNSREINKDTIRKETSEFEGKEESKKNSETINAQIRRKEDEERIIQDEAIRKAAEIAEINRNREEQQLAEEAHRKETESLKKQKEDEENSKKQKEETGRLKKQEKERLKKQKEEKENLRKQEEETERLKKQEEKRLKKQKEDKDNARKQKEETGNLRKQEEEMVGKQKEDKEKPGKQKEETDRLQKKEDEGLKKQKEGEERQKRKEYEKKLAVENIAKAKKIVEDNIKKERDKLRVAVEAGKLNQAELLKKKAELESKIKEAKVRAEIEQKKEMKRFHESKKEEEERTQEDWKREQDQRFKEIRGTQEEKKLDDERRAPEWKQAEDHVRAFRERRRGNPGVAVPDVHLAVVACGDRLEETVVMLKSARVLSQAHLHFHVFADDDLLPVFKTELAAWPEEALIGTTYHIHPLSFPADNGAEWKKLFKPCASQRLFLPDILENEDAILYVDTDILFLTPPEDLWSLFSLFNSTQIAGVTPEHEDASAGWYNRFARHPYYPPLGLNSGVMLMNLTRMREVDWVNRMIPYHAEYKYRITWGDQCLINIFFHFYPQMVYVYPCHWNFRPDHCMYMSKCKHAEDHGVYIVHGSRRVWFEDKQPAFKAIYTAFKEYAFTGDLQRDLLGKLREYVMKPESVVSNCGQLHEIITRPLEDEISHIAKSSNRKDSKNAKTDKR